jgi:hypothetical protein
MEISPFVASLGGVFCLFAAIVIDPRRHSALTGILAAGGIALVTIGLVTRSL